MRYAISILVALSVPTAASAANWVFVATCGDQDQVRAYSYDPASVRQDRGNVLVRLRGDYSRAAGSRAQEAQIVWSFNCASKTFAERSRTEYGARRKVVAKYRKSTAYMGVTQNSIAEKVFAIACA